LLLEQMWTHWVKTEPEKADGAMKKTWDGLHEAKDSLGQMISAHAASKESSASKP